MPNDDLQTLLHQVVAEKLGEEGPLPSKLREILAAGRLSEKLTPGQVAELVQALLHSLESDPNAAQ